MRGRDGGREWERGREGMGEGDTNYSTIQEGKTYNLPSPNPFSGEDEDGKVASVAYRSVREEGGGEGEGGSEITLSFCLFVCCYG